jgi:hypothetical protein
MTPSEVLNQIKEIKPCILDNTVLLSFLSKIEAKIRLTANNDEEFESLKYENINTDELLLGEEHSEIYLYYVASQIDLFTNDIASYNNFTQLYNNAMEEYLDYLKSREQETSKYKYDYKGAFE